MSSTSAEQRARLLVDRLPLVTYMLELEPSAQAVYASPQVETLFGFTPDEVVDQEGFWRSRIVDADLPAFLAATARLFETREQRTVEYRVIARDGREVWVRDVAAVAQADDGELYVQGYLTDVTREKELERELAAERAQTQAFFRDSAVGLGITDAEGRYVRVNDALARLNGLPAEDHIGKTLADIAPALHEEVGPLMEQVRRTGEALYQHELDLDTGIGRRAVLLSLFPIEAEGETQYGRVVIDITEQRHAESQRARAERQYRRLIEQLPLVTYVNAIEPVYRSTYVSPQIEDMFGYPAQDWLDDMTLWDRVVHPDDLAIVTRLELHARERGEPFELEYRIVRADGSEGWVLDLMETTYDVDGKPLFEQGFLVDVTERRESERLFRAVFDGAFEAVVICDDDGRFVDVNEAASALYGRTREDLLESSIESVSLRPGESAGAWQEFLAAGEMSGSHSVVHSDGAVRETEFAAKTNVLPGRHLCVFRDVTHRKDLERDLWRAQRLDSVGRLAGGVAQDFNNILTTIRGYAQLLLARTSLGTSEHHHAGEIDRAADRAAVLTAQLLAFGRRQVLEARPVQLNRLVESLHPILERVAGEGVELVVELDQSLRAVRVDPGQIEQVIVNLVTNAGDAMSGSGRVVLRTANVEVVRGSDDALGDLADGSYAVLSVEDTGPGIDESSLEHVFEPFFTTKDVGVGVGLGLATAYGIAKQSGGTITLESEPGRGATFSVYLPEAAGSAARAGEPPEAATGETLLVVEGDPAVRDVLFELLTEAGYRVLTARTAAEAMRLGERVGGGIDLVLTELADAQSTALAESLGRRNPAIHLLSVPKPYTPDELKDALRTALAVT